MKKELGRSAPAARKSAPRGSASRKTAARKTAAAPRAAKSTAKSLLTAGIKALGNAQNEAIARQSRLFESILGLGARSEPLTEKAEPAEKVVNPLTAALDPFGFRKFEDVFDQRVARALINLGVPTAEAFAALTAEVERLRDQVSALQTQAKKR